ncbi:iron uptake transporter deferrochelatase/peroxidase subunit [soil metagenome]
MNSDDPSSGNRLTRRRLLIGAGAAGAGIGLGAGGYLVGRDAPDASEGPGTGRVDFHGTHQAGIATPAQDRLQFAAFDLTIDDKKGLRDLLVSWTKAAERMVNGDPTGPQNTNAFAPPDDTGETVGLAASRLTITFGFGPTLFGFGEDNRADDRFGLAAQRPALLKPLPYLPNDQLAAARSGGDICVQACSDDPQVAFHAIRNLARIGRGKVVMRWSQLGFGRTASTSKAQAPPRNLVGFKDGTANIKAEDTAAMNDFVWLPDDEPEPWMRGGTYLVTRRIRMLLEIWDRAALNDQEATIGRQKGSGAPLGASDEFDDLPLGEKKAGLPVIPIDAHVRLASPDVNKGEKLLRRGYSFTDGVDESLGTLDAGLFFIAFQRDPIKQFFAIQQRLGRNDALNEYIKHVASGVFAIPRGVQAGEYVGQELFESA